MASPVSIGDAILLAKIAFSIGKAFTSGAKSAPGEFHEIQSLLTSISESLTILHDVVSMRQESNVARPLGKAHAIQGSPGAGTPLDKLGQTLDDTRLVLKIAEDFISKYSIIVGDAQKLKQDAKGDWRLTLKRSWRTVLWSKDASEAVC